VNRHSAYRVDVTDFVQWTPVLPGRDAALTQAQARTLAEAVALYRGEFLQGFEMGHSDVLEERVLLWHERLHQLALNAHRALADHFLEQNRYDRAQYQLDLDKSQEEAHRQVMTALTLQGQRAAALKGCKCRYSGGAWLSRTTPPKTAQAVVIG
jgi:DNA-binding SARP family transcriptional activator